MMASLITSLRRLGRGRSGRVGSMALFKTGMSIGQGLLEIDGAFGVRPAAAVTSRVVGSPRGRAVPLTRLWRGLVFRP